MPAFVVVPPFFHLLVDLEELRTGFPLRRSSGKSEVLPKVSSSKAKSCLRKPAFGRAMGRLDFTYAKASAKDNCFTETK